MGKTLYIYSVILIHALVNGADRKPFNTPFSENLDREGKVLFRWNFNSRMIKFQVTVPAIGWIGIGFSPSGTMKGADIIFAWMKNGEPNVLDMHAVQNGVPRKDTRSNFKSFHMEQNGTHTTLVVKRFLDTCDGRHDFAITEDTTRVLYAYGHRVPDGDVPSYVDYHGPNKGVKSLRLLDRKLQKIAKNAFRRHSVESYEVTTLPFRIPKRETYYHCFYHRLPDFDEKRHIVQFEAAITPGNERNLHHITMFHCDESLITEEMLNTTEECYVHDVGDHWHYCSPVVVSWAVGMTAVTLPKHVGIPLGVPGAPKVVKMEIHYDNDALERGIVDSSGFRILYTKKLREYDAGVLLTGHEVGPSLFVPQGSKDFIVQGHCTTECLGKVMQFGNVSEINVFGAFLHSHTAGHGMILRHYRNGTELQPLARDVSYDFDYQETKILSEAKKVRIGDNLIMECIYDTTKRKLPTLGGLSTRDEMCFGFVMYYPKIDNAFCQSSPLAVDMYEALQAKDITEAYYNAMIKNWTEDQRNVFNRKQLTNPIWELCRTLKGAIPGISYPSSVPAIKAAFVDKPGRCEVRKYKQTGPGKSHDVEKRSHGRMPFVKSETKLKPKTKIFETNSNAGTFTFLVISIGAICAVIASTVLGLIYYYLKQDR